MASMEFKYISALLGVLFLGALLKFRSQKSVKSVRVVQHTQEALKKHQQEKMRQSQDI